MVAHYREEEEIMDEEGNNDEVEELEEEDEEFRAALEKAKANADKLAANHRPK